MGPTAFVCSSALVHNLQHLIKVAGGRPAFPVIKAHGYGHDAAQVASLYAHHFSLDEVPIFCVARSSEASALTGASLKQDVLILSSIDWVWHEENPSHNILWTMADFQDLEEWQNRRHRLAHFGRMHLKINTGMNRLGITPAELKENLATLKKAKADGLKIEGLMTHFWNSDADTDQDVQNQQKLFSECHQWLLQEKILSDSAWVHSENSAALRWKLTTQASTREAFRPGIHLWGYGVDAKYSANDLVTKELIPAMAVGAPLRKIFSLNPGQSLSYGWRFQNTSKQTRRVATIALGYADGIDRSLSWDGTGTPKGCLYIHGVACPIISTVTMDMVMVLLDDSLKNLSTKTFAYWIHPEHQSVYDHASRLKSISYEVLCRVSYRLPRLYLESFGSLP
jgi:alanine racemase